MRICVRTLLPAVFAAIVITVGQAHAEPAAAFAHLPPLVSRQFDIVWLNAEEQCLAYAVEVESGGEPFYGKLMVAWVATKRADDDTTPVKIGSICDKVQERRQTGKGKNRKVVSQFQHPTKGRDVIISADSWQAARMIFRGLFVPERQFMNLRFVYNPVISSENGKAFFLKLACPLSIGKHFFCRVPTAEDLPLSVAYR